MAAKKAAKKPVAKPASKTPPAKKPEAKKPAAKPVAKPAAKAPAKPAAKTAAKKAAAAEEFQAEKAEMMKKLEAAKIKTLTIDEEELLTKAFANDIVDDLMAIGVQDRGTIQLLPVATWISRPALKAEERAPGESNDAVV